MLYIKPPRGNILLEELQECVETRIKYFLNKYRQDQLETGDIIKIQYLTLGSALDRTGHFMLRLLSAGSATLKELIPSYEARFIIERIEYLQKTEFSNLVRTTLRHLSENNDQHDDSVPWREDLKHILHTFKTALTNTHFGGNFCYNEECKKYNFKAPFEMCLPLVAKRELNLVKGRVEVPCGKWKLFLKHLLETFLHKCIKDIESKKHSGEIMFDERLKELKVSILNLVRKKSIYNTDGNGVKLQDLESIKESFPPCMKYLYSNLVTNHRLSHNSRFHFSLFLKDIGMSVEEAMEFWRSEYSKPTKCGIRCKHSWQKDSAKYTYGIRHMYGLEGKRAQYCTPTCEKIQGKSLGPMEEGGCPFMNFDPVDLKKLLNTKQDSAQVDFDALSSLIEQRHFTKACEFYRERGQISFSLGTKNKHETPVEYFFIMKNKIANEKVS